MPTLDNSGFAGEVLRHGTVPREEIGGDREGALVALRVAYVIGTR